MNIYLNKLSPYALSLREKMLPVLTSQQQKIVSIVSIILVGFIAICYAFSRYTKFKVHVKKDKAYPKSKTKNKMIKTCKTINHSPKKIHRKIKRAAIVEKTSPGFSKVLIESMVYQGSNAKINNLCVRVNSLLDKVKQGEDISNPLEQLDELKKEILEAYQDKILDSENVCLGGLSSIVERLFKYINISKPEGDFSTLLPKKIHKHIFSFVSLSDLASLDSVSTKFQKLARDEQLWERLCCQEDEEISKTKTDQESWKTFYQEKINLEIYTQQITKSDWVNVKVVNHGLYQIPFNREKAKWIHLKRWIQKEHPEIKVAKMNFIFNTKKLEDQKLVTDDSFWKGSTVTLCKKF